MFQATALTAARPTPGVRPALPITVAGTLRTASGLGESARLCFAALTSAGIPVIGVDLTSALMQRQDFREFDLPYNHVSTGPGTLIIQVNSPLVPLAIWHLGRHLIRDKYIIGYWAWELPDVAPDWRYGIPFVHEIWVPSTFTADAVRPIAAGRPVRVVPLPVAIREQGIRPATGEIARPFTVSAIFNTASSFARKNPLAVIATFRKAFGDDPSTRLIIKTSNLSAFPRGIELIAGAVETANNIVVIDKIMTAAEIDALYRESDVVVSLHRSEGFGLTIAEAMVRGLPVLATNWSGNVDFVTEETGVPVPYRLVPAIDPQGTYHHPRMIWAEPDIELAAVALRRLRDDPALRNRLGKAAAQFAARTWSADAFVGSLRQHLRL